MGPSERDRDREGGREGEWLRLEQRGGDGKKRMNLHDVLQKYPQLNLLYFAIVGQSDGWMDKHKKGRLEKRKPVARGARK